MYKNDIDYVLPVVKKEEQKSGRKKLYIIIAVVFVLIVSAVVGALCVIPKSIKGDWELTVNPEIASATPDEVEDSDRVYYTFSKPSKFGDGTYKTYNDGGVEEGSYKLSEKNSKKLINLGTEDLEYKITGLKFLGNAKLTITYPEYTNEETGESTPAQDYVFEQAKAPDYEKMSFGDDQFEIDEKLIGKWVTNERTLEYYMYELPYTQTVHFFDNGVFTIRYQSEDLALDRYMYYAYSVNERELSFRLVTSEDDLYSVSYDFDENGNLTFTDDSTNGSIFADAFFSTVTYYTPENLPKEYAENASETKE